jgi:adenylyltransferase/sulfurtransferase
VQATEAVKIILGVGETLKNRLLLYDALNMRFRELKLRRDKDCPVCGDHPTVTQLIDYQQFCGVGEPVAAPAVEGVIGPVEVKQKQDRGDMFTLIDVREPHEYRIASIPGAVLIPLGQLPARLGELDKDADIVAHCKTGARSQKAVDLLKQNGFKHVRNMTGGIAAWSDKVDPKVPKY